MSEEIAEGIYALEAHAEALRQALNRDDEGEVADVLKRLEITLAALRELTGIPSEEARALPLM